MGILVNKNTKVICQLLVKEVLKARLHLHHLLLLLQLLTHFVKCVWLVRIGDETGDALQQPRGDGVVHGAGCELAQALHQAVA